MFEFVLESAAPVASVRASGPAPLGVLCALAAFAGELCRRGGSRRLLADLSALEPDLSFTDHLQLAITAVPALHGIERFAAVVPPGFEDAPAARAARLAGLQVKTFLGRAEAEAWLMASGT